MRTRPSTFLAAAALLASQWLFPERGLAEVHSRSVTLGMHSRLELGNEIQRVSVGNPQVLEIEVLSSRELLALGKSVGRTNLLVWYKNGATDDFRWTVQRDLSLLQTVLRDIHPSVSVESAPDRDAVILRGVVPDVRYARLAEAAAVNYLLARVGGGSGGRSLLLPAEAESTGEAAESTGVEAAGETEDSALQVRGDTWSAAAGSGTAVINLIQVGELPATLEERLLEVIRPLGGTDLRVRRIVRGEIPDDTVDTLVLEGEVAGQVALSRILIAASAVLTGRTSSDIQVLANEAGALGTGGATAGTGDGMGFAGGGSSGRSIGSAGLRSNQLRANVARAKALSTANGRLLAFIHVRDLPQVRVQVRVFEVNRTKLKDWLPAINSVKVDPGQSVQPPLIPGGDGDDPGSSPDFGSTTWQMASRLLAGALTSQWQVVAGDFAIDVFMALLESEGVARSLARPTLTVLSGESAIFNVGGAIPIDRTLTTAAGNQSFSDVFFQEFGITLAVRPLVGDDDMITMDVSPDISFPDFALTAALDEGTSEGVSTAAFETRTLSTSTRLADGDVLAIGGLLQQQESVDSSYTPVAHQAPGVGWMAKSLRRNRDETEVLILVSPAIVRDPIPGVELWAYPDSRELLVGLLEAPSP
jgi:Flp pilus assembly secretin CpaC